MSAEGDSKKRSRSWANCEAQEILKRLQPNIFRWRARKSGISTGFSVFGGSRRGDYTPPLGDVDFFAFAEEVFHFKEW